MPGFSEHPLGENRPAHRLSAPLIEVRGVSRRYGALEAVSAADCAIERGIVFGLVGSDGAGKTTLLRMMATMLRPSTGRITIGGFDTVQERDRVKRLIGYMPQRFGLYQDLTVAENLDFFMDIYGIPARLRPSKRQSLLGFSNLLPFVERQARHLSGGMKQKLGLACVLVHEPEVLILDEPTNGVDPVSRMEFWEILTKRRAQGITIVVSTAYFDEAKKCDRILLMHRARILAEAAPDVLCQGFADLESAIVHHIQDIDGGPEHDRFGL